jgi:hypothetical protein
MADFLTLAHTRNAFLTLFLSASIVFDKSNG